MREGGIDEIGRSKEQQKYMGLLKDGSAKSLRTLSIALELDERFVRTSRLNEFGQFSDT